MTVIRHAALAAALVLAFAGVAGAAGRSAALDARIAEHAARHGVPERLVHRIIVRESRYQPHVVSRGNYGLMQIKPATARMLGYSGRAGGLYDPSTNLRYGMKYLAMAHRLGGGSVCGTVLKYNAGHGARRMNRVSAAYCSKVKRHLRAA